MPDLAKPDGYKLILVFLEKKGYKKDTLDRRLVANRRYEAISRRPGQTLQDFFATENMAYADAVKAGVGIDPDRRAYHMFIKSGLTDDRSITFTVSCTIPRLKDQEQLWILERFRKLCSGSMTNLETLIDTETPEHPLTTSDGTCGNDAPSSDFVFPVQGWHKGQRCARALGRRNLPD